MKPNALKSSGQQPTPTQNRRSIAAKIHEMRQPLQVMSLLHGILAEKVKDEEAQKMISRLEETLGSITQMLESMPVKHAAKKSLYNKPASLPERIPTHNISAPLPTENNTPQSLICIIDDDTGVRESMGFFLSSSGYKTMQFESSEKFLETWEPDNNGCLLVDALLPGMSGLELLCHLKEKNYRALPIMITGNGDVSLAVQAMKAGAVDFVEKPVNPNELLSAITNVLHKAENASNILADREAALARLACLSARERQIMDWIFAGHQSKNIAADLGISRRTVETHRANIMKKTGVRTLSGLLKLALAAAA